MKRISLYFFSLISLLSLNVYGADFSPTIYGFVKASTVFSDRAVDSFGRPNSVAYTAAGNPALSPHASRPTNSFQVQQSRIGIKTNNEDNINALVEFDFVDFSKSTPAVASNPSLRRATINFKQDDWTFNVGQDWDLVSPLAPYSYNYIGHYFVHEFVVGIRPVIRVMMHTATYAHHAQAHKRPKCIKQHRAGRTHTRNNKNVRNKK